jgi:hypothetical protein
MGSANVTIDSDRAHEDATIHCEPAGEMAVADDHRTDTVDGEERVGEEAGYGYGV